MPDLAESGRRSVLRVVDDQGRAESREVIVDIAP
jgi:penicillin-binding protein 1C